jgi:hypothetical protein
VSAGIAAVGAVENISANQSAKSAAAKNNAGAAQLAGAQGSMLNQAESVAQQPFTPYTGTLTAPLSGNEQQGVSLASRTANTGLAQSDNAKATGLIDQVGGSSWNADTAARYMNPYTTDVTNVATAAANKNYLQNLAGLRTAAAGSSAFGGSREAIQEGILAGQNQINIGSLTAKGNADAYDSAMKAWSTDNATKLKAADAYNQSGMDVTRMTSNQISDLMKTGGVAQVVAQTDLANQYGQFMRQQGWSAQQLNSLINAVGTAKGSTQQRAPVQSNTANQLLGLGSTIAGLFGGSSSNSGTPTVGDSAPSADLTNSVPVSLPADNFTATPALGGG